MRHEQTGMTYTDDRPQGWAVTVGGINLLYCTTEEEAKDAWEAINKTIEQLTGEP